MQDQTFPFNFLMLLNYSDMIWALIAPSSGYFGSRIWMFHLHIGAANQELGGPLDWEWWQRWLGRVGFRFVELELACAKYADCVLSAYRQSDLKVFTCFCQESKVDCLDLDTFVSHLFNKKNVWHVNAHCYCLFWWKSVECTCSVQLLSGAICFCICGIESAVWFCLCLNLWVRNIFCAS